MTDSPLATFDGIPVYNTAIEVRNLAGGLRDAMRIDPNVMRSGDRVFFICEAVVGDIDHDRIDKDDLNAGWTRVHVLSAEAATFVAETLVAETLAKHKARVALAKDDASGQQRIGHGADLELEHFASRHDKRRKPGCPSCEKDKALIAEEKRLAKQEAAEAKTAKAVGAPTPLDSARAARAAKKAKA